MLNGFLTINRKFNEGQHLIHRRRTVFHPVCSFISKEKIFLSQFSLINAKCFSSSNETGESLSDLATFLPEVRRLRIVTTEEPRSEPEALTSVERETFYTRHRTDIDDPFVQEILEGLKQGQRVHLARAITLVESTHPMRKAQAQLLLKEVLEYTRLMQRHSIHKINSFRIGIETNLYLLEIKSLFNFIDQSWLESLSF